MYIAMNRFTIHKGSEEAFEQVWRERETYLEDVPGFFEFQLLRCDSKDEEDVTLYASHAVWKSREDFVAWTHSESFRQAHKHSGKRRHLFSAPPNFEGFSVVINQ